MYPELRSRWSRAPGLEGGDPPPKKKYEEVEKTILVQHAGQRTQRISEPSSHTHRNICLPGHLVNLDKWMRIKNQD